MATVTSEIIFERVAFVVTNIIEEMLDTTIDIHDDLDDIDFDALDRVELIMEVESEFKIDIDLEHLDDCETVYDMVQLFVDKIDY